MVVNKDRHYWIGLGSESKKKKKKKAVLGGARKVDPAFNPGTQSTFFKTPPRLPKSNQALLRKSSSMILSLLDVYNEEIEKNKQTDAEDEQDDLDATTNRINSADDDDQDKDSIEENLRTSALVLLQQISKAEITDPVQAIEGLLKTIRVAQYAKQMARLSLVSEVESNNHTEEQEFETRESSFPTLSKIGVPITKRFVSYLLREVVSLSRLYPGHGLLSFQTHRGTSVELVKVTRSKNKQRYVINVRSQQSWLHRLPSLVVAEGVDPSVGATWILRNLASNFEDQFVHVCRKMGYPIFSKKMDAATACAMWQEANVSRKSQRTILRYLAAEYGCRLVVPEAEVDAFGQDHVPPVTGSFEDPVTSKTIHFWTKPIAKLLEVSVSTYVREKSIAADDAALGILKSIDVVLGGDHGQGKFRSVIKIILRDDDGKQVDSMVMKVGRIDCTKDTYKILKLSVAGPLNESIEEVVKSGALQLLREQDGNLSCRMKNDDEQSLATTITNLPIRVFVTGDLAYFAAILGKVNMAGDWCTWCGLSTKEWSPIDHDKGELWTLDAMAEVRLSFSLGVTNNTSTNR